MSDVSESARAFLDGIGGPSLSFKAEGAGYIGQVISVELVDQTDAATGEVKTFDNGDARKQLCVFLDTPYRDPAQPEDDGERRWFVQWKAGAALKRAERTARQQIGAGVWVACVHTSTDEPAKRGLSGVKHYAVKVWPLGEDPDPADQVGGMTVADLVAAVEPVDTSNEPF